MDNIIEKTCNTCEASLPTTAFSKAKRGKYGVMAVCKVCAKIKSKQYNELNKERIANQKREYVEQNKEIVAERKREYRKNHKESISERDKQYRDENKDKLKEKNLEYQLNNKEAIANQRSKYFQENKEEIQSKIRASRQSEPAKHNARNAERRAKQAAASVTWRNKEAILAIYEEAQRLTRETGIKYQVDHIIPLKHDLVSGLHVEHNLQILTESENARKKNKFIPGPWFIEVTSQP